MAQPLSFRIPLRLLPCKGRERSMILPIVRARERVDIGRSDSDTTLFADLMYYGELVMKLTVAGMLAAVGEDRERSNYRQCHDLVRADGLGSWADALDEVVSGA